ncbi:winged helix-turn-helix transcriptional regulator [Thermococcus sp. 101 C5]|uniref:Transcriptional regulator n=1 Tax=Thermococcus sibiricus TaxID=172049 RepID=A0A124FF50_9EURY|nr:MULTISPECIES: Lrp/AsnC family transcriptional regulator [Thermococcus]KUK16956.1 MAG: Transcriptional regulator [Thermococcus sibiricus]MPW39354.1 winged helix-turn-helix transcriptional regulator [Thermococcus sp. 101 C5]
MTEKIDEVDLALLKLLRKNSRISLTRIAKELGITVPAVKYRIQKLEQNGIIQKYSITINYEKLGYGIIAFVGINIDPTKRHQIMKKILELDEIIELFEVTGEYDIMVKIATKDIHSLREFLTFKLGGIGGVTRTYTMVIVREYDIDNWRNKL